MSWIAQAMLSFNNWYHNANKIKAALRKEENPLRIGILSAAAINYTALFDPVATHPGAVITAIGARSKAKAQAQIDANKLGSACRAYGSYDEVLDDETVDAVYIPLPNGLHADWAVKAMRKGKDVLIEKAITSNVEECRRIKEVANETGKVAVEAFHWRFHPAAHRVKQIVESGEFGAVKEVFARLMVLSNAFSKDDIRFQYALGGGACLDLAYVFSVCCYFGASDVSKAEVNVVEAEGRVHKTDEKVDESVEARFTVEEEGRPAVKCHVQGDLNPPWLWGWIPRLLPEMPTARIELEKARIGFKNFIIPTFGHTITITPKDGEGRLLTKKARTEKVYTDGPLWGSRGEVWWTTYRYQLEAFVKAVRRKEAGEGRFEGPWVELGESEKVMGVIDKVYERMGLPKRGL